MRNFHKHQHTATAKSQQHAFWLVFAVIGTSVVTSTVLVYLILVMCAGIEIKTPNNVIDLSEFLRSQPKVLMAMFAISVFVTTIAISLKSWIKIRQLRAGGGAVVARDLGGIEIAESDQLDLRSRQLLNVVQEVAVAASILPVPVYYMPNEPAINAFAAGYTPQDAIISVTKGCMTKLSRDQLQGVVAHEFSHILNGDMRQNIRIIGVLHGILFITETAELCWRAACEMWESDDPSGTGGIKFSIFLVLASAFLWPVGMIGLLFATIAKAAISRQREYLADATAVELTRNPHGIASALKRIAGFEKGTRVRSPMAVEASHLFFASGLSFNRILSTHPPVIDRIVRLDPDWDGLLEFGDEPGSAYAGLFEGAMNFTGPSDEDARTSTSGGLDADPPLDGDEYNVFADPGADENEYRRAIAASLSSELVEVTDDPVAAGAIIIALRTAELALPDRNDCYEQIVDALHVTLQDLDTPQRLLLFDKAVETISHNRADPVLLEILDKLAAQPASCLFEFAWNKMVESIVDAEQGVKPLKPQFGRLQQAESSCSIAISSLVHAGGNVGLAGEYAFQRGIVHLQLPHAHFLDPEDCDIESLNSAVETLSLAAPSARCRVCLTVGACITADGEITEEESLIVRGIVSKLGYPIPRLLPGHPVTPGA